MEPSSNFWKVPDSVSVIPYLFASLITVLFVSMFSVLSTTLLMIYKVAIEVGVLRNKNWLKKGKQDKTTETGKGQTNDSDKNDTQENENELDLNTDETIQLIPSTEQNSDTVFPDESNSSSQDQPKIRALSKNTENQLHQMMRLLNRANKKYFSIITCLMLMILLHLSLVLVETIMFSPQMKAASVDQKITKSFVANTLDIVMNSNDGASPIVEEPASANIA